MRAFTLPLGTALFLAATPLYALGADLSGNYLVEGRNADGSPYSGQLVLAQEGETITADWNVGNTRYSGYGALEGRVLEIQWSPGQAPFVYVTMPGGVLHGTWDDGYAFERAVRAQ
ncbi:MAG: hypothetical protein N4A53_01950 [Pelagimonas sp.]|nr:hypothetical protein [Pelagimonas sp.]